MTAGTLAGLGDATVGCSLPRMPATGNLERGGEGRRDRLQWDGWFRSRGHRGSPPVKYIPDTERDREREMDGGREGCQMEVSTAVSCVHVQPRILIMLR